MKKFLTVLTLTGVIFCASAFSACKSVFTFMKGDKGRKDYSETFTGAVSEQTYETKDEAVGGYLETEISGKSTTAVLVDYKVEKELTTTEVSKLDIPEEYTADLQSVEELTVEYSEENNYAENGYAMSMASAVADSAPVTYKRTVYLLTYTDMFRFFVPSLDKGDTLTASYYESTFEADKYVNCTMNVELFSNYNINGSIHKVTQKVIAKATLNALYEYGTSDYSGTAEPHELYMIDTSAGIYEVDKDFTKNTYDAYEVPEEYGTTINEYFMKWFDQRFGQLDHTFFEKTSTGYALRGDKYAQFLIAQGMNVDPESYHIEYVINIADGRMADVKMVVRNGSENNQMTIKFSNFGTTSISIPNEVKEQLPQ